jgi:hypothetical protein
LNAGGISPSTFGFLEIIAGGSPFHSGNLAIEQLYPLFEGLNGGLNAAS